MPYDPFNTKEEDDDLLGSSLLGLAGGAGIIRSTPTAAPYTAKALGQGNLHPRLADYLLRSPEVVAQYSMEPKERAAYQKAIGYNEFNNPLEGPSGQSARVQYPRPGGPAHATIIVRPEDLAARWGKQHKMPPEVFAADAAEKIPPVAGHELAHAALDLKAQELKKPWGPLQVDLLGDYRPRKVTEGGTYAENFARRYAAGVAKKKRLSIRELNSQNPGLIMGESPATKLDRIKYQNAKVKGLMAAELLAEQLGHTTSFVSDVGDPKFAQKLKGLDQRLAQLFPDVTGERRFEVENDPFNPTLKENFFKRQVGKLIKPEFRDIFRRRAGYTPGAPELAALEDEPKGSSDELTKKKAAKIEERQRDMAKFFRQSAEEKGQVTPEEKVLPKPKRTAAEIAQATDEELNRYLQEIAGGKGQAEHVKSPIAKLGKNTPSWVVAREQNRMGNQQLGISGGQKIKGAIKGTSKALASNMLQPAMAFIAERLGMRDLGAISELDPLMEFVPGAIGNLLSGEPLTGEAIRARVRRAKPAPIEEWD